MPSIYNKRNLTEGIGCTGCDQTEDAEKLSNSRKPPSHEHHKVRKTAGGDDITRAEHLKLYDKCETMCTVPWKLEPQSPGQKARSSHTPVSPFSSASAMDQLNPVRSQLTQKPGQDLGLI